MSEFRSPAQTHGCTERSVDVSRLALVSTLEAWVSLLRRRMSFAVRSMVPSTRVRDVGEPAPWAVNRYLPRPCTAALTVALAAVLLGSVSASPLSAAQRRSLRPTAPMTFHTYLGGSGEDEPYAITTDPKGNAYVVGLTNSPNFPVVGGRRIPQATDFVSFVTKLSGRTGQILASSYLGDIRGRTDADAVAVDQQGHIYVAGTTTSPSFPLAAGSPQSRAAGVFVAEFSPHLDHLLTGVRLGGKKSTGVAGMGVDASGRVFVAGSTDQQSFPVVHPLPSPLKRGSSASDGDGYILVLSPHLRRLEWSTHFGGSNDDRISGFAMDRQGHLFLTGVTDSSDFPLRRSQRPRHCSKTGCDRVMFAARLDAATRV
jgi:Beta-propeller repeat